ncbi:dimethylarginine dimethylaminohydrolase family protein [Candidatus Neomarinimicrobiota bacterium]
MFTNAIVRTPCKNIIKGLTSSTEGEPDYLKAINQHKLYINALKFCGLEVTVLPEKENYPDSTFVEDVALLTPNCAIITHPGAPSRQRETKSMKSVIVDFYDDVKAIKSPGTVDAGDIMMVGSHYYIGLSTRTNSEGANQVIKILEKSGLTGSTVPLSDMIHLKSGVAYLENNNLVVTGEFINKPEFKKFNLIKIDDDESYAANCVWINDYVLVAKGYPKTKKLIEQAGYKTVELDMSEFRKLDGGLSCLSLRF